MKKADLETTMLNVNNFSLNDFAQLIKSRRVVPVAIAAACLTISASTLYAERLPKVQGQQAQNTKITGYTRKLNGFTRELDRISEGLFLLTTNGGNEYCGLAIKTAVNGLQWDHSNEGIKSIFIAGNKQFTQGPVNCQHAVRLAAQRGVTLNTIHTGGHQQGIDDGWRMGASLAGGDYMSIDANRKVVHGTAPQDKRIAELNALLNNTYIIYGKRGASSAKRQIEQDEHSHNISASLLAKCTKAQVFLTL